MTHPLSPPSLARAVSPLLNDPRAGHTVNFFGLGTNVQIPYKGYTISLASDGQETCVFANKIDQSLFDAPGTGGEAVAAAVRFIDNLL